MILSQFSMYYVFFFFFQAEDGIRDVAVTGVQTCALPISLDSAAGQDEVHRVAVPDQPGQTDRAQVEQGDSKAAAEYPENRVDCCDAEVAPERELEASGDRVAFDGRQHRLAQKQACGTEGPPRILGPPRLRGHVRGDRLEVRPSAERASGAGQHGDARPVVPVVLLEGAEERLCGRGIHSVAHLRPVDGNDENFLISISENRVHADPVRAPWPCHCCILLRRVLRSMPSLWAAAVKLPPVASSTRRMWRRSTSARDRFLSSVIAASGLR